MWRQLNCEGLQMNTMERPLLLSRENAPTEISGLSSSQTEMDPEKEFHKLESLLESGGDDKLVDAYFK